MPFGTGHIWIIAVVVLIVLLFWGPAKLPELGAGLGRAIREFKKTSSDLRDNVVNSSESPTAEPMEAKTQHNTQTEPESTASSAPTR